MTSMQLTPYVPDEIWLRPYPVHLAGTRFDARMTVIRLSSGQLMLHSPCDITASLAKEISGLGPVHHIVAPGNFHHCHVISAQSAFPKAKTWICPGVERRRPYLFYDAFLDDVPPYDWLGQISQVLVRGTRVMREVAML